MMTKDELIQKICDDFSVTRIAVTDGANGYPRNLRTALRIYDWEDAEAIKAEHPEVEIVAIKKRDGHEFWSELGWRNLPYDMTDEYDEWFESLDEVRKAFIDECYDAMPIEEWAYSMNKYAKIAERFKDVTDGQIVGIKDGYYEPEITDRYVGTIYEDCYTYGIAITFDLVLEAEDGV